MLPNIDVGVYRHSDKAMRDTDTTETSKPYKVNVQERQ